MTRRGWKGLLTWLCWGKAWRFHWTWNVRQYNKKYDSKTGRQQQKPPQQMSSPAGGDRPGPDWHQHCIVHSSNIVWNISFEIRSLVAKERRGEERKGDDEKMCEERGGWREEKQRHGELVVSCDLEMAHRAITGTRTPTTVLYSLNPAKSGEL